MSLSTSLLEVFLIGVAMPLSAACVIPLYPAFVAYLAEQGAAGDGHVTRSPTVLGGLVVAGVVVFMALVGLVFTFVLQVGLSPVIEVVSPVAFAVLAVIGATLLADFGVFSRLPSVEPPQTRFPSTTAFGYGFFFGAIVIPCNPAFIALFFARAPILFDGHGENMLAFLTFGLGIGAPLLAFAIVSESIGQRATRFLARHRGPINRVTGVILLAVAVYYLVWIFDVLGVASALPSPPVWVLMSLA